MFSCNVGSCVNKGDVLGTVMTSSECDLEEIKRDFHDVFSFSDEPVPERTAVLKIIRNE